MNTEALNLHRALEVAWERMFAALPDACYCRRDDLIVWLCPAIPIPQVNGPWVVEGSSAATKGLADAIAMVEAAGALPWVQTRSDHDAVRRKAVSLGLSHTEDVPGMIVWPHEFVGATADIEIEVIADDDMEQTNELLAESFGAPRGLFESLSLALRDVREVAWYVGRADDQIVSTAVGFTIGDATGIFNVATPARHRGHGYGAALTSRAVSDGFAMGSRFAYLQSSRIGHNVYERLGFRDVEHYTLLTRPEEAPDGT